jgi:hypothetical protein
MSIPATREYDCEGAPGVIIDATGMTPRVVHREPDGGIPRVGPERGGSSHARRVGDCAPRHAGA